MIARGQQNAAALPAGLAGIRLTTSLISAVHPGCGRCSGRDQEDVPGGAGDANFLLFPCCSVIKPGSTRVPGGERPIKPTDRISPAQLAFHITTRTGAHLAM
jgi:hypothetical protein